MDDAADQDGLDPLEVEPTDNSSATPVDLERLEEVEREATEGGAGAS